MSSEDIDASNKAFDADLVREVEHLREVFGITGNDVIEDTLKVLGKCDESWGPGTAIQVQAFGILIGRCSISYLSVTWKTHI